MLDGQRGAGPIPAIAEQALRENWRVEGPFGCLYAELAKRGADIAAVGAFPEDGAGTRCPANHPLYCVGTRIDNGWECESCPAREAYKTRGAERYRCFRCDYDVCERCRGRLLAGKAGRQDEG